jgi:FKBP-type peptidyl-prolyl cis-trans isomerase
MKFLLVPALCLGLLACNQAANAGGGKPLKTQMDSVSYSIGLNIGKSVQRDSIKVDPDLIANGIRDAMSGGKVLLTDAQMQQVMMAFQTQMMAKQQEKTAKAGEANKAAGEKFLAENKSKPGVVTLPSGLQYQVLKEGTGPMPKATDQVVTKYRGTLIDGTEFDNSEKHGGTAEFGVNQVIPGWTEALQLMKVGSKWRLFVPSNLAYGPQGGPGGQIGPNETLIFDIELVSIK